MPLHNCSGITWRYISRRGRSDAGPFATIYRIQVNPFKVLGQECIYFLRSHQVKSHQLIVQNTVKPVFKKHHCAWLPFQCNVILKTFMVFNYRSNTQLIFYCPWLAFTHLWHFSVPVHTDLPYFLHRWSGSHSRQVPRTWVIIT